MPINIAVVDDHALFRKGVISVISDLPELTVVGEANDGEEALQLIEREKVDILLMDLKMPKLGGYEVLQRIKKKKLAPKSIIISMHINEDFIAHAIEMGAVGYIAKNADPSEILVAIQSVAANGYYFDEKINLAMAHRLMQKKKFMPIIGASDILFSVKEIKIIQLLAKELSNAEIADLFCLSPRTIETIRQNLIRKVGVKNVIGLILFAAKKGLIEL